MSKYRVPPEAAEVLDNLREGCRREVVDMTSGVGEDRNRLPRGNPLDGFATSDGFPEAT